MCGKSAEDHGVHGADSRAGQHRDCEFGRHAHIDGDTIAAFDADSLQYIGKTLHLLMEFGVGDLTDFAGFALPQERHLVLASAECVAVDAVVRQVQFSVDEPLRVLRFSVDYLCPGGEPVEFTSRVGPKLFGMLDAVAVHLFVLCKALDPGLCGEFGRRGKYPVLPQR